MSSKNVRKTVVSLLFFILLSTRSAQAIQPPARDGLLPPVISGSTPILYVGDAATRAVYLFDARDLSLPPLGKITDGVGTPFGIMVDSKGFIYVANSFAVEVYRPGGSRPIRAITDVPTPFGVGAGPNGTLAITGVGSQGGLLAIYDNGSRTPTRTIMFPPGQIRTEVSNPVFDTFGDAFVAVHQYPRGPAKVLEFAPGSTQGVDTGLPFGFALGIDTKNNVYVSFGSEIVEFHPGSRTPIRQITNGLVSTSQFAISPKGALFVVNTEHLVEGQPAPGNVVEFAPHGTSPIATLQQAAYDSAPYAVAFRPGG